MSDRYTLKRTIQVLLVEDNESDVRLFREAFKDVKLDNNITVIKDGSEVISYLTETEENSKEILPDIIFLDLNLPRKNGIEILKEIKNNDKLKTIPIIMLSTSNSSQDIEKCYESHANSYIIKPVDFDKFIYIIKTIETYWLTIAQLPKF